MGWSVIRFLAELDPTRIGSSSFSMRLLARLSKMLNRQIFNEDRPSRSRFPNFVLEDVRLCTSARLSAWRCRGQEIVAGDFSPWVGRTSRYRDCWDVRRHNSDGSLRRDRKP